MTTLIRKNEAARRVGFHPVHMMRKANDPKDDFPAPVKLGPTAFAAVAFVESELDAWIERRIAERDATSDEAA